MWGQWWEQFWFTPASARNLAAARIVTAATALWVLLSRDLPAISGFPLAFWSRVPWTTQWRYLIFPGQETLERLLQSLAVLALCGVLLGCWPRLCCFVAALLLYHLAPLEPILWLNTPYLRGLDTPLIALMGLSLAPCGDVWAVSWRHRPPRALSWRYGWPVRLIQVHLSAIYFFAAYSKLVDVGLGWATASNMQAWMLAFNQGFEAKPFLQPGLWLAAQPLLCQWVGIASWLLEFGFIAMLWSTRLRWLLLPATLVFHLGILLTMNITVLYLPFLLVFVNWDAFWQAVRNRGASAANA
ncbi:MAG: hypothetical protein AB7N91_11930 [Candidatus Tectimicrobiota bacterium]